MRNDVRLCTEHNGSICIYRQGKLCYKLLGDFYNDEKDFVKYINDNISMKRLNSQCIVYFDDKKNIAFIITKKENMLCMAKCNDIEYFETIMEKEDEEIFKYR